MNTLHKKWVLTPENRLRILVLSLISLLFSCSGKISIEDSVLSQDNVLSWSKKGQALTSLDIQDDAILNVLHIEHDIYGLIRQFDKDSNPNIEIEWFSADKSLIAKIKDHWHYDARFPDYFVAPDGERIIAIDEGNRIRLFNNQGKEVKRFKILNNFKYSVEHAFYNTTSQDFDLLFSGVHTSTGTTLILRTLENDIIFKNVYKDWNIRAIAISPKNKYYAASIYKQGSPVQFKTIVLDVAGKEVYQSNARTRRIFFDRQNSYVVFFDKNQLELVDLNSLIKVGEYSLAQEDQIIVAADFSNDGILLIQSAETVRNKKDSFNPWQYINNSLISLNMQAETIAKTAFADDWVIRPALWFDESRKQFFYGYNAGYRYISAKR